VRFHAQHTALAIVGEGVLAKVGARGAGCGHWSVILLERKSFTTEGAEYTETEKRSNDVATDRGNDLRNLAGGLMRGRWEAFLVLPPGFAETRSVYTKLE
jgi:hypothetical protein